jgi:O-antigen/teichoic acid export membrane protein
MEPENQSNAPVTPPGRARRAARNSLSLTGAEVFSRLFTWLTVLFLAHHWSRNDYGQYATAVNWVTIFSTLTGLGIGVLAVRDVAKDKSRSDYYLRNIIATRVWTSVFFAIVLIFMGRVLHYEPLLCVAMGVLGLRLLFDAPGGGYIILLQAHEKMTYQGMISLAAAFLRMAGVVAVVYLGGRIVSACWVWVAVSALSLIALIAIGRRQGWSLQWSQVRWMEAWDILKRSIPFAAFGTLQMLYYRVDSVILKNYAGNESVALYDMAGRLLFVVFMISDHFGISTLPSFSAAREHSSDLARLATRSLKLLVLMGLPLTVGGFLLASPLMALMFGPSYEAAGPAFAVLALSIFLHFATKPSINLLAVKAPARLTEVFFWLFFLNLAANFFAIPRWGLMGAAVVSSLCEVVFFVWVLWLMRHYFKFSEFGFPRGLMSGVLASAAMGLGIYWSPGLYWLVLGPLVYGGVLYFLRGLNPEDKASLRSILKI